ncbi:MAG: efflux RND transporter periplasmic adaptor subunit [Desulfobacterales bacterium]
MRRTHYLAAAFMFISAIFICCGEKISPGNTDPKTGPAISVRVMTVVLEEHPVLYEAVGSVKAQVAATISSKLMGAVMDMKVKEGDIVKKGDVLVLMDARQVNAQLKQVEAALGEAKKTEAAAVSALKAAGAGAEQARLAYNRGKKMLEGEAITHQNFESIEAQYKQAQASLAQAQSMVEASGHRIRQAQAAVDETLVAKKDARIMAPFDGKVMAKMVDVGDLASPGTPLLTIEGIGAYRVDMVIPEAYIQSIQVEQAVDVRIPAVGDTPIQGAVFLVVPTADQISRTFMVQVLIPQDERIRSGMFARVALPVSKKKMIRIPQTALVRQGQLTGVFIVDPDKTARFRLIRTGSPAGDQVEVISGIPDQTRIVVSPPPQLKNGSRVEWST